MRIERLYSRALRHAAPAPAGTVGRSASTPRDNASARFGEAAHLVDRLDLRPWELRRAARPWWRLIL